MDLRDFFTGYPKVAVACSGGVDSALLLFMAGQYAEEVSAYFVKSPFQPAFEQKDAEQICRQAGVKLTVIEADVLSDKKIKENPPDRCYYCKKKIFAAIKEQAEKDGYTVLLEGTNASDDISGRPGFKALTEYGVLSPLRKCGYTKERIRKEAKEAGLSVSDKPSYACLATRIPAGREITEELLIKLEKAEGELFSLGFSDFRIRLYHEAARIQLKEEEIPLFLQKRESIIAKLSPCFPEILLDMKVMR